MAAVSYGELFSKLFFIITCLVISDHDIVATSVKVGLILPHASPNSKQMVNFLDTAIETINIRPDVDSQIKLSIGHISFSNSTFR